MVSQQDIVKVRYIQNRIDEALRYRQTWMHLPLIIENPKDPSTFVVVGMGDPLTFDDIKYDIKDGILIQLNYDLIFGNRLFVDCDSYDIWDANALIGPADPDKKKIGNLEQLTHQL